MSGRGGRGHSGRGNSGRSGCGRGRGQNYSSTSGASKKGLCAALGNNVFDYGHKGAADQMRTSWEKLVQYVGMNYGQDISNELQNKMTITLPEPTHTDEVMQRHTHHEQLVQTGQANLQAAREQQHILLEALVVAGTDPEAPMKLAILQNEIAQADFEANEGVPIKLTKSEKTQHSNTWKTY